MLIGDIMRLRMGIEKLQRALWCAEVSSGRGRGIWICYSTSVCEASPSLSRG